MATITEDCPMSRHEFEQDGVRLAIGWDRPLATYFLEVWTGVEEEDDGPSIWIGTSYGEAPSPDPLLIVARLHLPGLPDSIGRQLRVDQLMAPARPGRRGCSRAISAPAWGSRGRDPARGRHSPAWVGSALCPLSMWPGGARASLSGTPAADRAGGLTPRRLRDRVPRGRIPSPDRHPRPGSSVTA